MTETTTTPVSAELVRRQGEELLGLERGAARCAELASEVERLDRAVAAAASAIEFDDEPLRYAARLRALRAARGRAR